MLPTDQEWLELYVAAKLDRIRAGTDITREMVRRSHDLLAVSKDLLKIQVPMVWHPEPHASETSKPVEKRLFTDHHRPWPCP